MACRFDDGYGSSCCHSTHRVGLDIDVHVDSSTHDFGNGFVDTEEQKVIDHAVAFIDAGLSGSNTGGPNTLGRVQRIIASNNDIRQGINAVHPGIVISDASGVHLNHMHFDIGRPTQAAGIANLSGDFNFDGAVDAADYTVWRDGLGITFTAGDYSTWTGNFGASQSTAIAGTGTFGVCVTAARHGTVAEKGEPGCVSSRSRESERIGD